MMVATSQALVALYIYIDILYKVSLNSNDVTYNGNYITFIDTFLIFNLYSLYSRIG